MKLRRFEVWSTALLLGLGLTSLASSPARAQDDEDRSDRSRIRIESEDDRDDGRGQGYLGVQVQRLTSALRRARSIPESVEGILVSSVESGSPASDGGVKRGDVIMEVDRDPVSSPAELVERVRALDPGKRVPVLIWRDGSRRTVTLTVGSRPEGGEFPVPPPMPRWEGSNPPSGPDAPDAPRPQMLRRRADMERQLRDIQDQLTKLREEDARLQKEIERLRADLREREGGERRDRDDRDRDRDDDQDD